MKGNEEKKTSEIRKVGPRGSIGWEKGTILWGKKYFFVGWTKKKELLDI